MKTLASSIELKIKEAALFHLRRGREADVEHTLRVVEYGKIIMAKEGGNPLVVIPTLYLHDVGWSRVDFTNFILSPQEKKDIRSMSLHMQHGAEMAIEILRGVDYDQILTDKIVSIIAIHDEQRKISAMDDIDATIVFEADSLDKFGAVGRARIEQIFGTRRQDDMARYLERYKPILFRTSAAKELLNKMVQIVM